MNRWHIRDVPHFWMSKLSAGVWGQHLNKILIFCVEFGADDRFWGQFEKNRQIKIYFWENIIFGINRSVFLKTL